MATNKRRAQEEYMTKLLGCFFSPDHFNNSGANKFHKAVQEFFLFTTF